MECAKTKEVFGEMARKINKWSKGKTVRKGQTARFKKMRSSSGVYVVPRAKTGWSVVRRKDGGTGHVIFSRASGERVRQPEPRIPLLSGGKDPTLAERFEEELFAS